MSAILIGNLSVGAVSPTLAGINTVAIAELQASLNAALDAEASLNLQIADPSLLIAGALSFNVSGQALLALQALTPAQLLASLQASLSLNLALQASLNASLSLQLALLANLSVGGVFAYAIDSTVGTTGGDISAALSSGLPDGSGPTVPVQGLLLLTDSPASFAALGATLRLT